MMYNKRKKEKKRKENKRRKENPLEGMIMGRIELNGNCSYGRMYFGARGKETFVKEVSLKRIW